MGDRVPNERLNRLVHEAGWTLQQLAQHVNRLGTERGTPRTYSAQTAWTWTRGVVPRSPETRSLIVEALARRLGRPIKLADAGFPESEGSPHRRTGNDVVADIIELGRMHVDSSRRRVVGVGLFSAALAIPGWTDVVGRAHAVQTDPRRRIGQAEVDSVDAMVTHMRNLDGSFGGQYARPMASAFLVNTVAPYLRTSASERTRKAMLSSAAMACYFTGWMAMDEGLQGLAQRYYVKGLELAGAADNRTAYGHILRGMSVQATNLGHGAVAARYATAAAESIPEYTPRRRAFMAGQQAHGYAMAGDRSAARHFLRETERSIDQASSPANFVTGGYSVSTVAYHVAQVRYEMGDVKGSIESLGEHFKLRGPSDSRRSELMFLGIMAERQLELGHLDAACATWDRVLTMYPAMHSGRVDDRVRTAVRLLAPHATHPLARQTRDRARSLLVQRNALST